MTKFSEKLKSAGKDAVWREYCGFLDLRLEDYMYIQRRLMAEQLARWKAAPLGKRLLHGADPQTVEEFRRVMPLTSYGDYADTLLAKNAGELPAEPVVWIQTTWEGGFRPIKVAPYSREMLDVYKHNIIAVTMLASGRHKGDYSIRRGDRVLYGGAPLPYATGLLPTLISEDVDFEWLPDGKSGDTLSFSQRIRRGFSMAMRGGVDYFFAIGSVANYITENFSKTVSGGGHGGGLPSPRILYRFLRARYLSRRDGRPITPGDVFHIKGFVCCGTDSACYKASLSRAWGVTPVEIAAGTESTCVAAETWEQSGMVFFPDACFYEFIPEEEMLRNLQDPGYTPRTCLMDEVRAGVRYELVISVLHGGAFMRYRIGDMYRCLSAGGSALPRFTFVDRVPSVIDIAGFTRLTEDSIREVIELSKLNISDWLARKEFEVDGQPYLHMYVELPPEAQRSDVTEKRALTEHLSVYFRYFDSDYDDLKKLLGMEPLRITILKYGAIQAYENARGSRISRVSPAQLDLTELLQSQYPAEGGGETH